MGAALERLPQQTTLFTCDGYWKETKITMQVLDSIGLIVCYYKFLTLV